MRQASAFARHDWMGIVVALLLSYGAFSVVAFAMGLDADDRLIANAVWTRVRGDSRTMKRKGQP